MQKIDENDIFEFKRIFKKINKVYKEHLDGIHIMTSGDISKASKNREFIECQIQKIHLILLLQFMIKSMILSV